MTDVLTHAPGGAAGARAPVRESAPEDPTLDPNVARYVTLFEESVRDAEPAWLTAQRQAGIRRFAQLGFPTRKNEDWHFTSVAPITSRAFGVARGGAGVAREVLGETLGGALGEALEPFYFGVDWHTLVFVNGVFAPTLSRYELAEGKGEREYYVGSMSEAAVGAVPSLERHLALLTAREDHPFTALNTAFLQDGAVIVLPPTVVVDRPIHLLFVADASAEGAMLSPRNVVVVGHHAEVTLVESYVALGEGSYFTNAVTEVSLGASARVRHYKIQRESAAAYHVGSSYAHQERDSHYESFSFAVGGDLSRTNIATVLDGPGAHATVNGLYMVNGTQTVDHQTRIEHAQENCTSHEVYKGVLDGKAHGVFNGKVFVRPEAQKTDGKQSNNNLLLSDHAHVDTKPQLEIFADDVKCTHGATVGRLDETALFYLKSRGIGAETSRRMLTYAFAAGVLEELTVDDVRTTLERLTFQRFGVAGFGAA